MKQYDNYLRWLYRNGHPNRFARLQNRATAIAFAAGIVPKRAAALEIAGRRSGRIISFPVAIADFEGERYLVSMLGKNVNWVRNLQAAGGRGAAPPGLICWSAGELRSLSSRRSPRTTRCSAPASARLDVLGSNAEPSRPEGD